MDQSELQKVIDEHKPFTQVLYDFIKVELMKTSNIKYHMIEHRTKTIKSLENKIARKNIKNENDEIMDITGIRIILFLQEDVYKVEELVKEHFSIDEKNSSDKAKLLKSNEFDYLSVHCIVTLTEQMVALPEWKKYSDLKAEIQIRTVLQHAWASVSHEVDYKSKFDGILNDELKRKLYRLAGLFELADEQFSTIKKKVIT